MTRRAAWLVLAAALMGVAPTVRAVSFEAISLTHPDLPPLSGLAFHATGLNNAGTVAGLYMGYSPWGVIGGPRATMDVSDLSNITTSGPLPSTRIGLTSQGTWTYSDGVYRMEPSGLQIAELDLPVKDLYGINDDGVAIGNQGWIDLRSGAHGSFAIDGLVAETLRGEVINKNGQILGRGYEADGSMQSFFYDTRTGQGHRLSAGLPQGLQYSPQDINDAGVMVVTDFSENDLKLYLVTADGQATNINAVPQGQDFSRSGHYALNNHGQVVSANYFYDGRSWTDLAQVMGLSVQYPGQLDAIDINDQGQILVAYQWASRTTEYYLLNPGDVSAPIPEPATAWLMGLGLLGLLGTVRRQRARPAA